MNFSGVGQGLPALEDTHDRALVSYMRGPTIFILCFAAFILSRTEMPLHGSIIYQKGGEVARYGSVWQDCFDKKQYESGLGPDISFLSIAFRHCRCALRVCRRRPPPMCTILIVVARTSKLPHNVT